MGHLVTVAATPLIARFYGPEAYGLWAGWLALVGLVAGIACLSYETAIALPASDHESLHVAVVAIGLGAAMSLLCGAGVIILWRFEVAGPWERLGHHVFWIPVGSLVLVGVTIATQWLARAHDVAGLAKAKIWASATTTLAQLAMGPLGTASGLILGDIIGRSAGLWRRLKDVWKEQARRIGAIRRDDIMAAVRCYRHHSMWMTPTVLLNILTLQAPLLLMLNWHGETTGGQYALIQRLLGFPLALLGQSVAQLFLPLMAKTVRSSKEAGLDLFLKLSGLLALAAATMVGVVATLEEAWLVRLLGASVGRRGKISDASLDIRCNSAYCEPC